MGTDLKTMPKTGNDVSITLKRLVPTIAGGRRIVNPAYPGLGAAGLEGIDGVLASERAR
ncbi:MAG: hypothetical protein CM1200mP18_13080 [Gammaproteobacteria bacterium]|nr:MAG: hypothetical protein CM1200mP18_13080 [Gammaproteobacteria bacterium]